MIATTSMKAAAAAPPLDPEAQAIHDCASVLGGLTEDVAERVLTFLCKRFVPNAMGLALAAPGHPHYRPPVPRMTQRPDDEEDE